MLTKMLQYICRVMYFIYCWATIIPLWVISYLYLAIALLGSSKKEIAYNTASRFTARLTIRLLGIRVKIIGAENIPEDEPVIFISNHQSFFDINLSFACIPVNFSFISKESISHVPILGNYMKASGHISLKREAGKKAYETMIEAIKKLDMGKSLVVFPEGTRSEGGKLGGFKRGISLIVLQSGKRVVPVAITGSGQFLPKNSILCNPQNRDITFKFGKPLTFPKMVKPGREEAYTIVEDIREAVERLLEERKQDNGSA